VLLTTQIINGLGLSAPILIVAIAIISSYSATRVLNVAVGGTYIITAYLAFRATKLGGPVSVVVFLLICLFVPVLIYLVIEFAIARPQRLRAQDRHLAGFGATLGISIMFSAIFAQITQGQSVTLPNSFPRMAAVWQVGGVTVTEATVVLVVVAILVLVGWGIYQSRSVAGRLYRATASDAGLARAIGIRVGAVAVQSWLISGLITGIAVILLFVQQRTAGPDSSTSVLLTPFAAVIVGGLGDLRGTLVASLIFGIGESLVLFATGSAAFQDVLVFGAIFIIMLLRPEGLGRRRAGHGVRAY
jgi:branched-chain amino acid transport system permease protein